MSTIIINGTSFSVSGSNISMVNGTVYVDGVAIQTGELTGIVKIQFEGDLASLQCDKSVEVNGRVCGNVKAHGSVTCGDVGGNVDSGGSTTCNNVTGDVDAGGSVHCGNVGGSVDAGGSIKMNR